MTDQVLELEHLALADAHLDAAEGRIDALKERIAWLAACGYPADQARSLLSTMLQTLDIMRTHRAQILAALAETDE
jgi:hypothetical protein